MIVAKWLPRKLEEIIFWSIRWTLFVLGASCIIFSLIICVPFGMAYLYLDQREMDRFEEEFKNHLLSLKDINYGTN